MTMDVSLLLATVIAGQAIIESLTSYFVQNPVNKGLLPNWPTLLISCCLTGWHHAPVNKGLLLNWPTLCQTLTVIITTLRFFHGNVMWYLWETTGARRTGVPTSAQKVVNKIVHYYIHIFQYLLFYVAGKAVGNVESLIYLFLSISTIDVVWTGYNWLYETDTYLRRALASWFILNFISAIAMVILLNYTSSLKGTCCCYILASVYGVAAIADYIANPKLYFGIDP